MKDLAEELGVSLMTISKALRGHTDVSEETRRRVLERARELNYRPNWAARSLVTRRTHMIGLMIPDLMHSFFAEIAKGVCKKVEPLGYQVVISNSEEDPEAERRHVEFLLTRSADGLIIASAQATGESEIFRTLEKAKARYVLIDRLPPGIDAHFVGVDDDEVGFLATQHLLAQGCRRIAHLRGPEVPTGTGRMTGYRRALAGQQLEMGPEYVVPGRHEAGSGYEAMRQLLRVAPRPDAVFCYNDPVAAGAIKAVLEAGLRVPEDIAIIGAGNVHYSDLLRVPLSTVDQSSSTIGEQAAELLVQCIEAKDEVPAKKIVIRPRVIARESSLRIGAR